MNELILLKNKPVIDYSKMIEEANEFKLSIEKYKNVVVTEENRNDMKKKRTEITKRFNEYEQSRKDIKNLVLEPYNEFENEYKNNFKATYNEIKKVLDDGIKQVEQLMIDEKIENAKKLFDEKNKFDWLTFDRVGLKVTLSTTNKSIESELSAFLTNVEQDLNAIELMEHSNRIEIEYRKNLNLPQSTSNVLSAIKQEEELKKQSEPVPVEKTEKVIEVKPVEAKEDTSDPFEQTLHLKINLGQLLKLTEFMEKEGIEYEYEN